MAPGEASEPGDVYLPVFRRSTNAPMVWPLSLQVKSSKSPSLSRVMVAWLSPPGPPLMTRTSLASQESLPSLTVPVTSRSIATVSAKCRPKRLAVPLDDCQSHPLSIVHPYGLRLKRVRGGGWYWRRRCERRLSRRQLLDLDLAEFDHCCRPVLLQDDMALRVVVLLVRIVAGRLAIHLDDEMVALRDDLVGDPLSGSKRWLSRPVELRVQVMDEQTSQTTSIYFGAIGPGHTGGFEGDKGSFGSEGRVGPNGARKKTPVLRNPGPTLRRTSRRRSKSV